MYTCVHSLSVVFQNIGVPRRNKGALKALGFPLVLALERLQDTIAIIE
jgi:hypothetical protein